MRKRTILVLFTVLAMFFCFAAKPQTKVYAEDTVRYASVGTTINFSFSYGGASSNYQWQYRNGTNGSWINSTETGATSQTIVITMTLDHHERQYRCVATKAGYTQTSSTFVLKLAPSWMVQPEIIDPAPKVGEVAEFHAKAIGDEITYNWQYSTEGYQTDNWQDFTANEATISTAEDGTTTLSFTVKESDDGKWYRCIATDRQGNTSPSSTMVMLAVQPEFKEQPSNQEGYLGDTVEFKVEFIGSNKQFQWKYSDDNGNTWKNVAGNSQTNKLSVTVQESFNNRLYCCFITYGENHSTNSNYARLKVLTKITTQPQNQSKKEGETAQFTVGATGVELSYQWQYQSQNGTWYNSTEAGAQTTTLSVVASSNNNGRKYRCVVRDANGKTTNSNEAALSITTYTIMYHETTDTNTVSGTSKITYGTYTPIKTINELGYSKEGRKFLGWRAFRETDGTWYMVDKNGKYLWSTEVPEGGKYYLYTDGIKVAKTTVAGTTAHFYGVWADTYTICYHETINTEAVSGTSQIIYGTYTPIKTINELGYSKEGRKFLGWRAFRETDGTWYMVDKNGKYLWSTEVPEGGKYYLYTDGIKVAKTTVAGTTAHFYGVWADTYTICYHETINTEAVSGTSQIIYGTYTPIKTINELGYSKEGRKFLGWRAFRETDGTWYMVDKNGKYLWSTEVPEGGKYYLYTDGIKVAKTTVAGTTAHFYGVWADTYTICYHETINTEAVSGTSQIIYGTYTPIKTINELGYSKEGRKFLGWRAFRETDGTWYMVDKNGKYLWSTEVPEGGKYYLYTDGIKVAKTTVGGTTAHFYGVWADTYTICYHETINTEAVSGTSQIIYGTYTPIKTIDELGYSTNERTFQGWAVQRESDGKWYVQNAAGKSYFASSIPAGGSLCLYTDGIEVAKTAPVGTIVHFYGQWDE